MPKAPDILLIGVEPGVRNAATTHFEGFQLLDVPSDLDTLMALKGEPRPLMILCGPVLQGISMHEVAQMLRMRFRDLPIYYVTETRRSYDRKNLIKNGYTDGLLMTMDRGSVWRILLEGLAKSDASQKAFRPVRVNDLAVHAVLEFDLYIYLPANRRYVEYHGAGKEWDPERLWPLVEQGINFGYVPLAQSAEFDRYVESRKRYFESSNLVSATEIQDLQYGDVRTLLSFTINDVVRDATVAYGESILEEANRIVKTHILPERRNTWTERVHSLTGALSDSNYSHALNVSMYSAMFAQVLGVIRPEDLALAAHDVGLADVPEQFQRKNPDDWTFDEKDAYHSHVNATLRIVDFRKIRLPGRAYQAIKDHHEFFEEGGYPRGLGKGRTSMEAQILATADVFDELTTAMEGRPRILPETAFDILHQQLGKQLNPKLTKFLAEMFKKDQLV